MTVETDQARGRPPGAGPPVPTQKPPPVSQKPPPPVSQKPSLHGSTVPQQQQQQQQQNNPSTATQQSQPQRQLPNGGAAAQGAQRPLAPAQAAPAAQQRPVGPAQLAQAAQRPVAPAQAAAAQRPVAPAAQSAAQRPAAPAAQRPAMQPQTRPAVPSQQPQAQRPLSASISQTQRPPVPSQKPSMVSHLHPQHPQTAARTQSQTPPCNGEVGGLRVIDLDALNDNRVREECRGGNGLLDTTWMLKQYHHRLYHFNILCVGETGIGKSTLMDTLFNTHFDSTQASHDLPGVKLKSHTYELKESNVRLKLTFVDTVGFGDQIDKTDSAKPIVDYIDEQFEIYLQEELKIKRSLHSYHDTRVHVCLYFIAPTGHSLKSLDLVTMKALDSKVNIVPVIAKADTITKNELHKFKLKIMSELVSNGVQIYQFPTDDDTVADLNSTMNGHLPFAVVGSMDEVKVGNKMVKARQYPWGTVQVENESHCDFVKLREMLIRTNMEDLQETTHYKHYELYRRCKLQEMGFSDDESMSLQQTYEQKRNMHMAELQKKEEEMRQMFVVRVKEKETELKEAEKELHAKFDVLKKQHADEKNHIETARRILEEEMNQFNKKKTASAAMLQSQQQTSTMSKKKK